MIAPARDDDGPPIDYQSVAVILWHHGKKNREIAEALGVSRPKVSRMLAKALDEGKLGPVPHAREFGLRLNCDCETKPIRAGEVIVCVSCCSSGWDFSPLMHAEALPPERKAYRPTALKGGSGDAPADESAGQEAAAEAIEDGRLGTRAGRRSHARGRRR
ncbi:MAG: hypothetical protein BGO49_07135 [Planctomycetales bacterium 71-10]|nr:MAG: hypothetical protein BGO49_07135 [Planctomycetales bacterium 71-10]